MLFQSMDAQCGVVDPAEATFMMDNEAKKVIEIINLRIIKVYSFFFVINAE